MATIPEKLGFIAAKIWRHAGRSGVSYSDHCEQQGIFQRLMDRLRGIRPNFAPVMEPAIVTATQGGGLVPGSPAVSSSLHAPGSSWLNRVERFFAELSQPRIRRGTFRNVPALIRAIMNNTRANSKVPRPFVWTAAAPSIIRQVRYGERNSGTGPWRPPTPRGCRTCHRYGGGGGSVLRRSRAYLGLRSVPG